MNAINGVIIGLVQTIESGDPDRFQNRISLKRLEVYTNVHIDKKYPNEEHDEVHFTNIILSLSLTRIGVIKLEGCKT